MEQRNVATETPMVPTMVHPNKSLLSLETTQISSVVEWVNKLKNNHGLQLNRKKKQSTDTCNNLDGSPEIYAE